MVLKKYAYIYSVPIQNLKYDKIIEIERLFRKKEQIFEPVGIESHSNYKINQLIDGTLYEEILNFENGVLIYIL